MEARLRLGTPETRTPRARARGRASRIFRLAFEARVPLGLPMAVAEAPAPSDRATDFPPWLRWVDVRALRQDAQAQRVGDRLATPFSVRSTRTTVLALGSRVVVHTGDGAAVRGVAMRGSRCHAAPVDYEATLAIGGRDIALRVTQDAGGRVTYVVELAPPPESASGRDGTATFRGENPSVPWAHAGIAAGSAEMLRLSGAQAFGFSDGAVLNALALALGDALRAALLPWSDSEGGDDDAPGMAAFSSFERIWLGAACVIRPAPGARAAWASGRATNGQSARRTGAGPPAGGPPPPPRLGFVGRRGRGPILCDKRPRDKRRMAAIATLYARPEGGAPLG